MSAGTGEREQDIMDPVEAEVTHQETWNMNTSSAGSRTGMESDQTARMRELLSNKEAELVEVKSELIFTRKEANNCLSILEHDCHVSCLEVEVEKLRESKN